MEGKQLEQKNIWQEGTRGAAARDIAERRQYRDRSRYVSPELEQLVRGDLFRYLKERNEKVLQTAALRLEAQIRPPASPFETFGMLLGLSRQSLGDILLEEERMAFLAKESLDPVARRIYRIALAIMREEMSGMDVGSYRLLCDETGGLLGKISRRMAAKGAESSGAGYCPNFFPALAAMQGMQSVIFMRLAKVSAENPAVRRAEKTRIVESVWMDAHWNCFLRFITDAERREEELVVFSRYLEAPGAFEEIAAESKAFAASEDRLVCYDEEIDYLVKDRGRQSGRAGSHRERRSGNRPAGRGSAHR